MPKGFRGVVEGLTKFPSPPGEKQTLFMTKELTVCFAKEGATFIKNLKEALFKKRSAH
jgi:hypothetical protein